MSRKLPARGDGAIVIGGDYRGLGIVRSLGRRRIPVCVITDEHTLAGFSRFASYRLAWPKSSDEVRLSSCLTWDRGHSLQGGRFFLLVMKPPR
jgi:D-aspartate ligase